MICYPDCPVKSIDRVILYEKMSAWLENLTESDIQTGPKGGKFVLIDGEKKRLTPKQLEQIKRNTPAPSAKPVQERKRSVERKKSIERQSEIKVKCFVGRREWIPVPIPKKIIKQYNWPTTHILMYKSSGTSEANSFPGTYFPVAGIQDKVEADSMKHAGYILKFESDQRTPWQYQLCQLMDETTSTHRALRRCRHLQENFLRYFSFWWQVRLSAALSHDDFWQRPDMKYIRDMAKMYSWNEETQEFEEDTEGFTPFVIEGKCQDLKLPKDDGKNRHVVAAAENAALKAHDCILATDYLDVREFVRELEKREKSHRKKLGLSELPWVGPDNLKL